ncbi:ribbon-helix-helix domain-containing protein [Fretibacter rubidus]|uniref:ribbon-helix-helix domain-containing protein n=1 Tax=Fretibacter rubidus TaxID=570162 RepID=UPI003529EBDD
MVTPPQSDDIKREKRSLSLYGHRTSVALETPFWAVIDDYARDQDMSLASLLATIDDGRIAAKSSLGLAAYLRVWALRQVQNQLPNVQ